MAALLGALVKQGLITEEQLKEAKEKQAGAKPCGKLRRGLTKLRQC